MVEVYINHRRCYDVESQLTLNWDLKLPDSPQLCADVMKELELAITKLNESNEFIKKSLEESFDPELSAVVEENDLVIRRKKHQIEQIIKHLETLPCSFVPVDSSST